MSLFSFRLITIPIIALSLLLPHANAQLDAPSEQGLKETKELLKSPSQRGKFMKESKPAQDVDAKVEDLAGSGQEKEEIYGIAAEVMDKLTRETKGDPEAMQRLLLEAQKNPHGFYEKMFDGTQKTKLRNVAEKIEKKNAPSPGAPK